MGSNSIPEKYHTDALFLLIGTNPLPNYVAALLLLKPGGTVYLVHSRRTKEAAVRLAERLEESGIENSLRLPIRSGEPDTIYSEVKANVCAAMNEGSVGLNYTGGTKVMAVHAHRAMEQAAQDAHAEVVFSYLDANTLKMVIDPIGTASEQRFSVSRAVCPSLEDLLYLHKIQLVPGRPLRKPYWVKTANALAALHSTQGGIGAWAEWCAEMRREDQPSRFKGAGELKQIHLPGGPDLTAVTSALQADIGLDTHEFTLGDVMPQSPWAERRSRDAMEGIAKWLDGTWLEHYTLAQLQEIAAQQNLHPMGMGIGLDTDPDKSPYDFEVDVAAMRGYQLFAISCTRDDRSSLCRFKLLEAYIRASQLGGEEARVGLVCCHSDPAIVQKEVEDAWGVKDRVRVFGCQDLPRLSGKLAEWFEATP